MVDTSIWIDHLNKSEPELVDLLTNGTVCIHPFIIGELACGNIVNRLEILSLLKALPCLDMVLEDEVYSLIEIKKLYGIGLGFVDLHLIAASLVQNAKIWTRDKNLRSIASKLNIFK